METKIGKFKDINKLKTAKEMSDYMEDRVVPITKEFVHRKKNLMDYKNESIRFFEDYLKAQNIYFIREKTFFTEKGDLFYADFYIPETRTVIELDGGYHETDLRKYLDKAKELLLASRGCPTIRFKNEDVFSLPLDCMFLFNKKSKVFWNENKKDIENYGIARDKWERYNDTNRSFEISKLRKTFEIVLNEHCLDCEVEEFNRYGEVLWTFDNIFECHFKTGVKFKEVLNKFNTKSKNWKTRFRYKSNLDQI
jgi:hypothetical protein